MILAFCLHLAASLVVFCYLADEHELTSALQIPLWFMVANAWPAYLLVGIVRTIRGSR